jgi:RHS repeat-associated protein
MARYEYSSFGELLRCEGSYARDNPFRFSTKFTDDESGLVYYGARYYSPSLGRFINRDPIEEKGGLNLYGFAGNDGVNGVDVHGMFLKKLFKSIGKVFKAIGRAISTIWDKVIKPFGGIALQIGFTLVGMPWVGAALGTAWDMAFNGLTWDKALVGFAVGGIVGKALGPLARKLGPILGGALIGGTTGGIMSGIYGGNIGAGILMGAAMGGLVGGTLQAAQGSRLQAKLGEWTAPLRGLENAINRGLAQARGWLFGSRKTSVELGELKFIEFLDDTPAPRRGDIIDMVEATDGLLVRKYSPTYGSKVPFNRNTVHHAETFQSVVTKVNAELRRNPELARQVLSPEEIAAIQDEPWLAKVHYGNAVERLVAQEIRASPSLRRLFEHLGGPNRPDFRGIGDAQGLYFDITTTKQVIPHFKRPYGDNLIVTPYEPIFDW